MTQPIRLFMWGYQPHFRFSVEYRSNTVLDALGLAREATVLLVGARRPGSSADHPVCIEPEDAEWPTSLFDALLPAIEQEYRTHDLQTMVYGDSARMAQKPERIRRDATRLAVQHALAPHERAQGVRCFCGVAAPVEGYYVVPVIQLPSRLIEEFPPVRLKSSFHQPAASVDHSLLLSAIDEVLEEATAALHRPDPGRRIGLSDRPPRDLARAAATRFMSTVSQSIDTDFTGIDLFESLNTIASLMYEGAHGHGRLILASPSMRETSPVLRFTHPVPLSEPRWARKVLELARGGAPLVADSNRIYGLGAADADASLPAEAFTVRVLDHYHWELRQAGRSLITCRYGEPRMPQDVIRKEHFMVSLYRFFPEHAAGHAEHIWGLLLAATRQPRGAMLVIASDAAAEAHRLDHQGTAVAPARLTESLLACVSGIDGSMLVDPAGTCHAVGVILDGAASPQCSPARGSRYNSAVRYVQATPAGQRRIAIVVSEDRSVDVIPALRPNVSRATIEQTIIALERATLDDYHVPRNWVNEHRFYFDALQCARVNAALDRLEAIPAEVGQLVLITSRLQQDGEFDPVYLDP